MNPKEQLDPQVVNLAKAIRAVETGGQKDPWTARGGSQEYGAYQFTPGTWQTAAKEHLGRDVPLDKATPQEQNEVAYKQILKFKQQGYNPGQIASLWNSGKPDAYMDPKYTGVNKYGVKYDVPQYAKSVAEAYQSIKGNGEPTVQPITASTVGHEQRVEPQGETYGAFFKAKASDTPLAAGAKAIGNVPSSVFNLGKGLLSAVTHPVQTVKGIFNTVAGAGESFGRFLGSNTPIGNIKLPNGQTVKERLKDLPPDQQEATFNAIVGSFKDRYGSLEAAQKTATNDPVGVGADILTILEGGAGAVGKVGALEKGLITATKPVVRATDALVTGLPKKIASETLGLQTGVGSDPIRAGYQAAREGGPARKAFTEAMRGKVSPDELVTSAKEALGEVVAERRAKYQDMLAKLGDDTTTYDISRVTKELKNQLERFKVGITDEGLDFSRSKFALDGAAQKDIERLTDYVQGYGSKAGDRTALGIDNLKQVLGGYWSPNSDYRAFVEGLRKSTRQVLDDAPGYSESMKQYSEMSDYIDDLQRSLSLGDKAMVETTFKKLTSSLKNNDFRKQILQELDADTGGQLISKIAGQRMSSLAPRGLAQYVTTGIGGLTLAASGGIMPLLGIALTTSPRIVGEFVRALGIGAGATKQLMNTLNRFSKPAVIGGGLLQKINPAAQE